ncbi:hypothetical protein ACJMK2_028716 [Sinanodonta woodiana]|uniref:Uncharacterized protein n=1 Tax=Sinanodonta woodiana TaxID=1069815 RepID=A0ABD3X7Y1_SINWO
MSSNTTSIISPSSETTKPSTTTTVSLTTAATSHISLTSEVTTTNGTTNRPGAVPTTNQHELTDGQIAGIAVGVIVFVIIFVAIIVFITIRRKRRHGERPISGGDPQDQGKKEHDEKKHKRSENKYIRDSKKKVDKTEVFYENPAGPQPQDYYNVDEKNSDSDVKSGSKKPALNKQDSVPTIFAPPPPSMEESRTSMPVEIAPKCPVIEEDEYIIPEAPSNITVAKRPPNTIPKSQTNDDEFYLDMRSTSNEEVYIDPDSRQDQKNYMNFDAKSQPVKDEERKVMPMDYVNLSQEERGVVFGVHPKQPNAKPKREATAPVTKSDEESYQNVLYENRSMQNKKPQRKK